MIVDNFSNDSSHKVGESKPGLKTLRGRNYDASRVAVPSVVALLSTMFMSPGVQNNRPNNYQVKQESDRVRFYREARENKVIYSGDTTLQTAMRLGGTNE